MTSGSKITIFLTLVLLAITSGSCNKKNDVIPYVFVDFTIDLTNPAFANLNAFGGVALINASTSAVSGYNKSGYAGNGIIVFAGVDEFSAYDRTCPHDFTENGLSVVVNIDASSSIFAVCPKCGTKYALSANGTPASGVGRYPLKNYRTSHDGRYVMVSN